jgi:hypothetical protein
MGKGENENIKLRLATVFRKILDEKKVIGKDNKAKGVEDLKHIDNMRQLESSSGSSFTIIQRTFAGKRDIQFTTLITLIDTLGITFSQFANLYDAITKDDIKKVIVEIEGKKRNKKTKRPKKST